MLPSVAGPRAIRAAIVTGQVGASANRTGSSPHNRVTNEYERHTDVRSNHAVKRPPTRNAVTFGITWMRTVACTYPNPISLAKNAGTIPEWNKFENANRKKTAM